MGSSGQRVSAAASLACAVVAVATLFAHMHWDDGARPTTARKRRADLVQKVREVEERLDGGASEAARRDPADGITGAALQAPLPSQASRALISGAPAVASAFFLYRALFPAYVDPEKPAGPPSHGDVQAHQFVTALFQFMFSSVGMMVGNKMAVDLLADPARGVKLPSTLVIIQIVGTILLIAAFWNHVDEDKLTLACVRAWLPIFTLFAGMLYTSAKTFVYAHVSFVIVMRNFGAIVTTVLEYFARGIRIDARVLASEIVIVGGTCMYGWVSRGQFRDFYKGLFWCIVNVCCQCCYGVVVKYQMDNNPDINGMSKYTMSLFNNLLCLPYLLGVAALSGEMGEYTAVFPVVTPRGWGVVAATCIIGFVISTSGFALQKLVSATTFLVVNNMTKILNILLGVIFLGDHLKGTHAIIGCIISLAGGFWYSMETMRLAKVRKEAEAQARDDQSSERASPPPAPPGVRAGGRATPQSTPPLPPTPPADAAALASALARAREAAAAKAARTGKAMV